MLACFNHDRSASGAGSVSAPGDSSSSGRAPPTSSSLGELSLGDFCESLMSNASKSDDTEGERTAALVGDIPSSSSGFSNATMAMLCRPSVFSGVGSPVGDAAGLTAAASQLCSTTITTPPQIIGPSQVSTIAAAIKNPAASDPGQFARG